MGSCYGESADNMQVIAADKDHILSSKKVEADHEGLNLNTVECLRGRLLAERQASRVAKMEAESMGNKLVEMEKLLREEIKLRDKVERRLKLLKKKVGSFNIPSKSGQLDLELSDSSEKCENSCGSSSSITSLPKHSEANEIEHGAKIPAFPENVDHSDNVSEASTLTQIHNSPSSTKDSDSQNADNFSTNSDLGYSSPQILSQNLNLSSENLKKHEESRLSSRSSVTGNESDHADFYDNSLALVPVTVTTTSQVTNNPKPINVNVIEALDALRHARERLLRQMIHVGPISAPTLRY